MWVYCGKWTGLLGHVSTAAIDIHSIPGSARAGAVNITLDAENVNLSFKRRVPNFLH